MILPALFLFFKIISALLSPLNFFINFRIGLSISFFFFFLIWNASQICVSSLRRGHANLLCIVPILVYVLPKQAWLVNFCKKKSNWNFNKDCAVSVGQLGAIAISIMCYMLGGFSGVQLYVTAWTVAHQAPLSMGFSR